MLPPSYLGVVTDIVDSPEYLTTEALLRQHFLPMAQIIIVYRHVVTNEISEEFLTVPNHRLPESEAKEKVFRVIEDLHRLHSEV